LRVELAFPATRQTGIDPQIAGGFGHAAALLGHETSRFSRSPRSSASLLSHCGTPPLPILSPFSRCPF
jgi:hypothetical protein